MALSVLWILHREVDCSDPSEDHVKFLGEGSLKLLFIEDPVSWRATLGSLLGVHRHKP